MCQIPALNRARNERTDIGLSLSNSFGRERIALLIPPREFQIAIRDETEQLLGVVLEFFGRVNRLVQNGSSDLQVLRPESQRCEWPVDVAHRQYRTVQRECATYGTAPLAFPQETIYDINRYEKSFSSAIHCVSEQKRDAPFPVVEQRQSSSRKCPFRLRQTPRELLDRSLPLP